MYGLIFFIVIGFVQTKSVPSLLAICNQIPVYEIHKFLANVFDMHNHDTNSEGNFAIPTYFYFASANLGPVWWWEVQRFRPNIDWLKL